MSYFGPLSPLTSIPITPFFHVVSIMSPQYAHDLNDTVTSLISLLVFAESADDS